MLTLPCSPEQYLPQLPTAEEVYDQSTSDVQQEVSATTLSSGSTMSSKKMVRVPKKLADENVHTKVNDANLRKTILRAGEELSADFVLSPRSDDLVRRVSHCEKSASGRLRERSSGDHHHAVAFAFHHGGLGGLTPTTRHSVGGDWFSPEFFGLAEEEMEGAEVDVAKDAPLRTYTTGLSQPSLSGLDSTPSFGRLSRSSETSDARDSVRLSYLRDPTLVALISLEEKEVDSELGSVDTSDEEEDFPSLNTRAQP